MTKTCFIIFAHCDLQNKEDVDDIIDNISHFHKDCDFIVNHPTINHNKIFTRHKLGPLNNSSFIFGAFREIIEKLNYNQINSFDHFCLVSANQYFISDIILDKNINYFQFFNNPNWSCNYSGKDNDKTYIEGALNQCYGRWDDKSMFQELDIKTPMASNWECGTLTKEAVIECKNNFYICDKYYPNCDLISLYPGYMALKTKQPWEYPSFFGTFDPSCPSKNWIINVEQVKQKKLEGYCSIKRVNYSKNCKIKQFIRENYYAS